MCIKIYNVRKEFAMSFTINNNYSPNFMAKKPSGVTKRIGNGFKHFKETNPEGYKQVMAAINEKNPLKLPKYKSAVDFYKSQGFEKTQFNNLTYISKLK